MREVSALAEVAGTPWPARQAFFFEDEDAILHVLHVTSGLNSLILGDAQILTQVKDAYRVATDEECVGAVLHRLMHTAFRTAKQVIHETDLNCGSASVTAAALLAGTAPGSRTSMDAKRMRISTSRGSTP